VHPVASSYDEGLVVGGTQMDMIEQMARGPHFRRLPPCHTELTLLHPALRKLPKSLPTTVLAGIRSRNVYANTMLKHR
jgi:hypothetical protein